MAEEQANNDAAEAAASAETAPQASPETKPAPEDKSPQSQQPGRSRTSVRNALRQMPSWLVSMVLHMVILLGLALWSLPPGITDELRQLIVSSGENDEFDDLEELDDDLLEDIDITTDVVAMDTPIEQETPEISPAEEMEAAAVQVELSEFGLEHAPKNDLLASIGAFTGKGLEGRGSRSRAAMLRQGGSKGSEKAVGAALKWLAAHQMPDGGWNFNHAACPQCNGACRNAGSGAQARRGATAMALLPFLGAGQTHKEGNYKQTVKGGLYFLVQSMKMDPRKGGSMYEPAGSMYSHGLGSITLCEAYAMTHDKGLHMPAQAAINFICYAQDPVGGGWRYTARQPGDTSVVGWQIMALKSGHMAYLNVPGRTVTMASRFLDSVQANGGSHYGYVSPAAGPATTAIGLLCRMYLGWKKDNPALQKGVKWLSQAGPSPGNMYYNYYATQVMRHWEGEEWEKWNAVMRDQLVNSQATAGHEAGSWFMAVGDHGGSVGGRLYCTSMATMILEVYYRHMPIYRKQSTEEEFPE